MSGFQERFDREFDRRLPEVLSAMQDTVGPSSSVTPEDLFQALTNLGNLVEGVKDEVSKIEHRQKPEDEEKKKKKQPKRKRSPDSNPYEPTEDGKPIEDLSLPEAKQTIRDILESLDRWINNGLDLDPVDTVIYYMKPFVDTILDGLKQIIEYYPVIWAISHVVDESVRMTKKEINSDGEKSRDLVKSVESSIVKEIQSQSVELQRELAEISYSMAECCESMNTKQESANDDLQVIKHQLDELNPTTQSNNVLELIQRQKAIQATLNKIRGLL